LQQQSHALQLARLRLEKELKEANAKNSPISKPLEA